MANPSDRLRTPVVIGLDVSSPRRSPPDRMFKGFGARRSSLRRRVGEARARVGLLALVAAAGDGRWVSGCPPAVSLSGGAS